MLVRDPQPRNAFAPRAGPATIFGPRSSVSGGMWTYQRGAVKCRTNLAVKGMSQQDLSWVKIHMVNRDPPDAPLPLPEPQLYDSCSLTPSGPADGAATRDTATCQHCLAERRKRKATTPHTLVFGECLGAAPPPPAAEAEIPEVNNPEPEAPDEHRDIVVDGQIIEELVSDAGEEDAAEDIAAAVLLPEQGTFRFLLQKR